MKSGSLYTDDQNDPSHVKSVLASSAWLVAVSAGRDDFDSDGILVLFNFSPSWSMMSM